MTPLAPARAIALSLAAHVAAGALLLAVSAPDWTRPLFIDLAERAESIGGHVGTPRVPSGEAHTRRDAGSASAERRTGSSPARHARRWPSKQPSKRGAPIGTSSSNAAAQVKPGPPVETAPEPRPLPSVDPSPNPEPASRAAPAPPPTTGAPPATADRPTPPAPNRAPGPGPTGTPAIAGPSPSIDAGQRSLDGGAARGRGEVRGDAGSSTGGPPGAALALGTGDGAIPVEYGPYLRRFRHHVQEALVYPLAARRRSLRGTVELDVTLDPTGRVLDVRVARSSSHGVLDDAALETVRGLEPLPLPEALPRRPLLIRLPLVFDLR